MTTNGIYSNYLWTYFEWLLSFPEGLMEMDRAKCIFGCNSFNSCFPNEVIMLITLKSSTMKRKTSQFQALLPPTDTTLYNSPDNIINEYKWNEYFVTVKCSAYMSHIKGALNRKLRHTDSVDTGLMSQREWEAVIKRFLCITDQFRAFSLPVWLEQRTLAIESSCSTCWTRDEPKRRGGTKSEI